MTAWLSEAARSEQVFTPEDLSGEHRAIRQTVAEFWAHEIEPNLDAIWRHEPGIARELVRKSGELGLTAMQAPEAFGGAELDLPSVMIVVEGLSADGSYSGWHFAHSGIGMLPLVYYGSETLKRKYLPRMATVDLLAAYALTEAQSGSDARALTTRADLTPDGRHYLLSGQKMWITNGSAADVFTVFAKVGGEHLTAFLVERSFGLIHGAQEHKMGLEGTATTALYFDRMPVPVENVIGDIGQGHLVAFNVLNVGRLKMGPVAMGSAKKILRVSIAYARDRRAFGVPIAALGAVQQMLADAAIRLYAAESATWRATGRIAATTDAVAAEGADRIDAERRAFEAHAAECSIVKIVASEMVGVVADIGVQVHGGYGYHRDYFVERAYRDARINRIFEGTNEINRLVIPTLLLKQAARDASGLMDEARRDLDGLPALAAAALAAADDLPQRARTIARMALAVADRRHGAQLRAVQAVTMAVADAIAETYVIEAACGRARQRAATAPGTLAVAMATVYAHDALARVVRAAEAVIAATCDAADAHAAQRAVRALGATAPCDLLGLRQSIAERLVEDGYDSLI